MRFFSRSIMGVFLAAVTIGLLALAGQIVFSAMQARMAGGGPREAAEERVISANVIVVQAAQISPVMTVFGEVRSTRTLQVRSSVGGTVVDVAPGLEDGAAVKAGQVLIRLDPADATSVRDQAQAAVAEAVAEQAAAAADADFAVDDLAAARAQADLRAQALTRQQDLRGRGLGSDAAVEDAALVVSSAQQAVLSRRQAVLQAQARVQTAANAVARAKITLRDAERALEATVIRAAFAGRLNAVNVVLGGQVSPNEVLAEVVDPAALQVAVRLSTVQLGQLVDLRDGMGETPIKVFLDATGDRLVTEGALTRVAAAVGDGESGRLAFGTLTTPADLRPGDFVTVQIAEPALANVALLPATAVNADGMVLALGADDRLEEVAMTVLRRQGDDVIAAANGLTGREVVAERSPLLGAGIRVAPIRSGQKVGG
jgi:multidrug resistance efflux pump